MLLLLFLLIVALLVVATHRIWEATGLEYDGDSGPADLDGLPVERTFADAVHLERRRRALRLGAVSILGVTLIGIGGVAGGIWGLAAGTAIVVVGLWWALRGEQRGGGLTDRERRAFEEIAAMFGRDDQGHPGRA